MKRFLLAAIVLLVLSGCTYFGTTDEEPAPVENIHDTTATALPYEVSFTGLDGYGDSLREALRAQSNALRLQDRPTSTLAGLRRRGEDDVERFVAVMQSFGFYDAVVNYDIHDQASGPLLVNYQIEPGSEYLLSEVAVRIIRDGEEVQRPLSDTELERVGLTLGMPVKADAIVIAETRVVEIVREKGFPLARAGKRKAVANTEHKAIDVTYEVLAGRRADFGEVSVQGATEVDPDFIASYAAWEGGQQYSPEAQKETRTRLAQSKLFDSVTVVPAGKVTEDGNIPMEIQVVERKHRTIGGGVDYSTADGPGANAFWEHRNFFGRGERLRLRVQGSTLEQGVEGSFRKPQFLRDQQALVVEAQAKNFDTDAYAGSLADGYVGVDRQLSDTWSVALGVTAEYSDLTGTQSPDEEFYLGGLRGTLRRDSTDNPLDPTKGSRFEVSLSPYTSLRGEDAQFTSISVSGSRYYSFDEDSRWILAGRGRIGTIIGESLSDLPSNKRFYAGGGGSIRGYEYQSAGPLDSNNDPTGGRSVIDAGLELRARVTEDIGIVPFVEGGNVFESTSPEDFDLFYSVGLGMRYYTAIGPLRFDVAVPLDKREDVDDDFQIYISIGQAF